MSARAVLKEAADCGLRVRLSSRGRVQFNGKPPADLLAKLRADEAEVIAFLRLAMSSDSVPAVYADAWGRLQCQKPYGVTEAAWRQAVDDAGRFLDQWRNLAAEFEWSPGDLFDAPHDGKLAGLAWWLRGETVRSFGPEHAVTEAGSVFDRLTRSEWQNPYQRRK
jgi:hypothetical protein